jgi:hypothetical protein
MGFGSFVQVLRKCGSVPASLLPSVARLLVHSLKQLHALKHVSRVHYCLRDHDLMLCACTQCD